MNYLIKTATKSYIYDTNKENTTIDLPIDQVFTEKNTTFTNLALVLGFKCNQHCSYCNQNFDRNTYPNEIKLQSKSDYEKLASTIVEKMLEYHPTVRYGMTVWGGETLLYSDIFRVMYPILNKLPYITFTLMTNGKLLPKNTDLFTHENIHFAVSYDGRLTDTSRGYNPAKDVNVLPLMKELARDKRLMIGAVLTPYHKNYRTLFEDIESTLQLDNYIYNDVKCIYPLSDTIKDKFCFKEEDLPQLEEDTYLDSKSNLLVPRSVFFKLIELYIKESLCKQLPIKPFIPNYNTSIAIHLDGSMTLSHTYTPLSTFPDGESCVYDNIYTYTGNKPEYSHYGYTLMREKCDNCFCKLFKNYGCHFSLHDPTAIKYREYNCKVQRARLVGIFRKVIEEVVGSKVISIEPISE